MSVNYASGLSDYDDKGVCGLEEVFENEVTFIEKISLLSKWVKQSKHCVLYCGAGLSTAAGIPDFRGPNGVWTLEKKGKTLDNEKLVSFDKCAPTFSHLAISELVRRGHVKYVVSQNIDGLFVKANIKRRYLSELHGNYFVDECFNCHSRFIRNRPSPTMGCRKTGDDCPRIKPRPCRGYLTDTILDWEQSLPDEELNAAIEQSKKCDLAICLGTTLQIEPAASLPLLMFKKRGRSNNTNSNDEDNNNKNNNDANSTKKIKNEILSDIKIEELKKEEEEDGVESETKLVTNSTDQLELKMEDDKDNETIPRLVIINLQATRFDKKANLIIHQYIDRVMKLLCESLSIVVDDYHPINDPTKSGLDKQRWNRR